jgi:hypothetical protein
MKFILALAVMGMVSSNASASCKKEAKKIAWAATNLFAVNDQQGMHCMAVASLKRFESLPVIQIMPNRYAYEAEFFFPCGPQPKKPVVNMLLNDRCEIVDLSINGHEL